MDNNIVTIVSKEDVDVQFQIYEGSRQLLSGPSFEEIKKKECTVGSLYGLQYFVSYKVLSLGNTKYSTWTPPCCYLQSRIVR